jgi:hypothetical protein
VAKGNIQSLPLINHSFTEYAAAPNKRYMQHHIIGGPLESGSNGIVAWQKVPGKGASLLEGSDKAFALQAGQFYGEVEWRKLYPKVECVAEEMVENVPCYKVVLTPNEGKAVTKYFDKESGLVRKMTYIVGGPTGDAEQQSFPTDYKKVDGILLSHKQTVLAPGRPPIVITITSIQHNVDMPANIFDLPADVQRLVEGQK